MNVVENVAQFAKESRVDRVERGRVSSKDGSSIAFERVGQGPPVILVVGALCSRTLGPGVKLAPELAERFSVFTYDRRGRGESSEGGPYAVEREVEDLAALLEEAGGSACVFGHSSGAMLALIAAASGLPIEALALYEPPFIVDHSRPSTERDWAAIDAAIAAGRRGDAVTAFMKCVGVPGLFRALLRWLPIWSKLLTLAHTLPHDGAIARDLQRGEPIPRERFAKARQRALLIVGGKSPDWLQNGVRALGAVLPQAKRVTLPGQTHDVNAKVLAPCLLEFFGQRDAAAAARP